MSAQARRILISVGFFVIGWMITGGIISALHNNNGDMSPLAIQNTRRNAAINTCIAAAKKSTASTSPITDDQANSYCGCVIDKFYAEYGDRLYTDQTLINSMSSDGFNQGDTALIQQCMSDAGVTS